MRSRFEPQVAKSILKVSMVPVRTPLEKCVNHAILYHSYQKWQHHTSGNLSQTTTRIASGNVSRTNFCKNEFFRNILENHTVWKCPERLPLRANPAVPNPTQSRPPGLRTRQPVGQHLNQPQQNRRLRSQKSRKKSGNRRCPHRTVENYFFLVFFRFFWRVFGYFLVFFT